MAFTDTTAGTSAHDPDDISLFLRQLLHRSSSTPPPPPPPPSSATLPSTFPPPMAATHHHQILPSISSLPPISTTRTHLHHIPPTLPAFPARISDDTLTGVVLSAPAPAYLPAGGGSNLSSESLTGSGPLRSFENEYGGEDCDCESEEAPDTAADGAEMKHPPPRNQSKRSRAAEVHNLSEKRRRSRINEKMKALQNLIPNSNKTDKASMLDEAIEYLKQLQLQVQMLSMRNGLSLHPMCLPSVSGVLHPSELSQMGLDFSTRGGRSLDNTNPPNEVNIMQSTRSHAVFNPSKQCVSPTRPPLLPNVSSVMNPEPSISYSLDSCIQDNFGPFQLRNFPQAVCRNQNDASNEGKTLLPPSFETGGSDIKGKSPVEAQQTQHNYGLQEMLP